MDVGWKAVHSDGNDDAPSPAALIAPAFNESIAFLVADERLNVSELQQWARDELQVLEAFAYCFAWAVASRRCCDVASHVAYNNSDVDFNAALETVRKHARCLKGKIKGCRK